MMHIDFVPHSAGRQMQMHRIFFAGIIAVGLYICMSMVGLSVADAQEQKQTRFRLLADWSLQLEQELAETDDSPSVDSIVLIAAEIIQPEFYVDIVVNNAYVISQDPEFQQKLQALISFYGEERVISGFKIDLSYARSYFKKLPVLQETFCEVEAVLLEMQTVGVSLLEKARKPMPSKDKVDSMRRDFLGYSIKLVWQGRGAPLPRVGANTKKRNCNVTNRILTDQTKDLSVTLAAIYFIGDEHHLERFFDTLRETAAAKALEFTKLNYLANISMSSSNNELKFSVGDGLKSTIDRLSDAEASELRKQRVIELAAIRAAEEKAKREEEARFSVGKSFTDCSGCPEMVVVPSGSFRMGSPSYEHLRVDAEERQRTVRFAYKFAVGKYEITWAQWEACVSAGSCNGSGPQSEGGDEGWGKGSRPVINVNWNDAKAYAKWLSSKTGHTYRLLSEAEWEYAARAGTTSAYSFGATVSSSQANYDRNVGKTTPVGQYPSNAFGLYDMHGNVWEWVEDRYKEGYSHTPSNGSPLTNCSGCSGRVYRGGSWPDDPRFLRSAYRDGYLSLLRCHCLGFRLARDLQD